MFARCTDAIASTSHAQPSPALVKDKLGKRMPAMASLGLSWPANASHGQPIMASQASRGQPWLRTAMPSHGNRRPPQASHS